MIKPLTSLRFLFALMVFLCHLYFGNYPAGTLIKKLDYEVFRDGYLGVSFFFILSGFILAYNYNGKFIERAIPKRKYYLARFARIYPLHFLTLLLAIPYALTLGQSYPKLTGEFLANLTLTHSFIPFWETYYSFNAPSWSLSDEVFFYAIFPFLVLFLNKKVGRTLLFVALALVPILVLITNSYFNVQGRGEIRDWLFFVFPLTRLLEFSIGVLLYRVYKRHKLTSTQGNLLELGAIMLFILFFLPHTHVPFSIRRSFYYWLPMAAVIYAFSFEVGYISRLLSHQLFIVLGEVSFAFYLLHFLVIHYYDLLGRSGLEFNPYIKIIVLFSITLALSFLAHYFIEVPANIWIKGRGKNTRPALIEKEMEVY